MIYLGGDMLSIGQQIRREWEKQELQRLGFKVYAPHDDKGINDKANAKQDKLAERIVANDTECTDIRQGTGHISDEQDRAEFSINQYVYGVIMDITDSRGIQTFDEICEELIL
ncbi:hypothetical protein [Staphylococcus haemolyticus]|uniref:hypothetical protein n=1 Tax=Staphylococcus haemolyticus TaxID=1283 RepID=UPI00069CFE84|nr:hypothetical protein [Staphylococcus haemolyticus]